MVTQAPKRSAVAAAVAFALSCIGLIIFVWTQFGGSIPFAAQGYRVHATFKETGLLVPGADVRISGVTVGKVTGVQARGIYSDVTLDLKRQYSPIPADAQAILRQKTLLGEAFVALSTGTGSGPKLPDGGTIPPTQIQNTVSLDQALQSFDTQTQQNLQKVLQGTYLSLAGRGQQLNYALGNTDAAITELSAVVGILNQQQANVQSLVNNAATVLTTVGDRSADLQSLITAGDQVLSTTAARDVQLVAAINSLPPFLTQLRTTLSDLNVTLGLAKPSLDVLRPNASLLPPALSDLIQLSGPAIRLLREAPTLITDSNAALPAMTRFTRAFDPAVRAILPAAEQVIPMIGFIGLYANDIVTAMVNYSTLLEATGPAATTTDTMGTPAGHAHYARVLAPLNSELLFGESKRPPTNRHNAYYSPGSLLRLQGGLTSSDCNNLGNAPQLPLPGANVPCVLQPPFAWGTFAPTTKSSYYPHLTPKMP
jgi:phospholipid/cholesterol/gamma-HCH transport system substrate-binding protein